MGRDCGKIIEETSQLESSVYISWWQPGRITLINSVLDSLPTYVMSVFPIPSRVEERLDKLEDNTIIYMVVNLEKETIDVLRILPILFRQSKKTVSIHYTFGVKV